MEKKHEKEKEEEEGEEVHLMEEEVLTDVVEDECMLCYIYIY
jgi:uncharacterized metal-binding protein YceD (DUF177 family)